MIPILIFAEASGLYGMIIAIILPNERRRGLLPIPILLTWVVLIGHARF